MTFVNRGMPMILAATLIFWLVAVSVPQLREGIPWLWPATLAIGQTLWWALRWLDMLVSPVLFWGIILGEVGLAAYCGYLSVTASDSPARWGNAFRFLGLGLLVFVQVAMFWASYGGLWTLPGWGNVVGLVLGMFLIALVHHRDEWFPDG